MDQTVIFFDRILSYAGIKIFSKTNRNSKAWRLYQVFNIMISVSAGSFTTNFFIHHFWNFSKSIQAACLTLIFGILFFNLFSFFFYKKDFESYIDEMVFNDPGLKMPLIRNVLDIKVLGEMLDLQEFIRNSEKNWVRLSGRMLRLYWSLVWFCVTLYFCGPIYIVIFSNDRSLRILPLEMEFPWSIENFSIYICSFIYQTHAGYLCSIAYPCFLSFLILISLQITRQLNILAYVLNNLHKIVEDREMNKKWEDECYEILRMCIVHYLRIKSFTNRLNATCKEYFLVMILLAMSLEAICFVELALSHELNIDTMKYAVLLSSLVLGIFILCYLGQLVDNACKEIEEAATKKWYTHDTRYQKSVLFFYTAISQGMPIYIYGSVTLSLETFTWFVKTGFSFYTVVRSVLEE